MPHFEYTQPELDYLKRKDERLAQAIDRIGYIKREVIPDLFVCLVNCIVGQQISSKALNTVWNRMLDRFDEITPDVIANMSAETLQSVGITMKKANYIKQIADAVMNGSFPINDLFELTDEEVCKRLISLPGVGIWTAEMLMIFSMQRKDVLSWDDLAIRRGIMLLYNLEMLVKKAFDEYKRRYSPYGSIASLYLWEISLGK